MDTQESETCRRRKNEALISETVVGSPTEEMVSALEKADEIEVIR